MSLIQRFTQALQSLQSTREDEDDRLIKLYEYCKVLQDVLDARAQNALDDSVAARMNELLSKSSFAVPVPPKRRSSGRPPVRPLQVGAAAIPEWQLFVMGVSALTLKELAGEHLSLYYPTDFEDWWHSRKQTGKPKKPAVGKGSNGPAKRRPLSKPAEGGTLTPNEFVFEMICPLVFPDDQEQAATAEEDTKVQYLETLSRLLKFFNYTTKEAEASLAKSLRTALDVTRIGTPRLKGKELLQLQYLQHAKLTPTKGIKLAGLNDLVHVLVTSKTLCHRLFTQWGWVDALGDRERLNQHEYRALSREELFKQWNSGYAPANLLQEARESKSPGPAPPSGDGKQAAGKEAETAAVESAEDSDVDVVV